MIEVMVNGCNGKMGQIVCDLVDKNPNMILKCGADKVDTGYFTYQVYTNLDKIPEKPDVIIDFSIPVATFGVLEYAKKNNVPVVIATTGFTGEEEKKIVSYHEVGHAMAIAVQKNTEPVQKITIVPRTMGVLGYTMQVPEEEKYLMSKEQMLSELVTLFGGRAAEEVVFNSVTTGASNDIERATQIARAMVTQYGMSERFGLMGLESVQNRYLDGRAVMNCSDATGALIDEEVKEMLKVAYDKAKKIIEDHREVMDEIAEFLIEKETITGKEFMEIYNKSLKKDELESVEANVEEDKEKTELSEAETVSEESSLKDAERQDSQKVTEKKDSEHTKQEE